MSDYCPNNFLGQIGGLFVDSDSLNNTIDNYLETTNPQPADPGYFFNDIWTASVQPQQSADVGTVDPTLPWLENLASDTFDSPTTLQVPSSTDQDFIQQYPTVLGAVPSSNFDFAGFESFLPFTPPDNHIAGTTYQHQGQSLVNQSSFYPYQVVPGTVQYYNPNPYGIPSSHPVTSPAHLNIHQPNLNGQTTGPGPYYHLEELSPHSQLFRTPAGTQEDVFLTAPATPATVTHVIDSHPPQEAPQRGRKRRQLHQGKPAKLATLAQAPPKESDKINMSTQPQSLSLTSAATGPMGRAVVIPPRMKPGRKASKNSPTSKRQAQNREAQRNFRERKASERLQLERALKESELLRQQEVEYSRSLAARLARITKEHNDMICPSVSSSPDSRSVSSDNGPRSDSILIGMNFYAGSSSGSSSRGNSPIQGLRALPALPGLSSPASSLGSYFPLGGEAMKKEGSNSSADSPREAKRQRGF